MENDLLQKLAGFIHKALAPLVDDDPETRARLLRGAGIDPGESLQRDAAQPPGATSESRDLTAEDWKNLGLFTKTVYSSTKDLIKNIDFSSGYDSLDEVIYYLIQLSTTDLLKKEYPGFYYSAQLLGFIQNSLVTTRNIGDAFQNWKEDITKDDPEKPDRYMRILGWGGTIFSIVNFVFLEIDPDLIGVEYGSEIESENGAIDTIAKRTMTLYFKHNNKPFEQNSGKSAEAFLVSITLSPNGEKFPGIVLTFRSAGQISFNLSSGYVFEISAGTNQFAFAYPKLAGMKNIDGTSAYTRLRMLSPEGQAIYRLGNADGTNFAFHRWGVEVIGNIHDVSLRVFAEAAITLVRDEGSDNFVKKHLLKNGLRQNLKIALGLSASDGIFVSFNDGAPRKLTGGLNENTPAPSSGARSMMRTAAARDAAEPSGGGLDVKYDKELNYDIHKSLGPLKLQELFLAVRASLNDEIARGRITLGANIGVKIGPFEAYAEGMGMALTLEAPQKDFSIHNLGVLEADFGFKPPNAIGLSLKTKLVEGEGFLKIDTEQGLYEGALSLRIGGEITASAVAIIHTRLPEDPDGYALLLLINVTFDPGWVLPFGGITVRGLGGILGLHRSVNTANIRSELPAGGVGKILFPTISVSNLRPLLRDLNNFFPVKKDQFFGGIMARMTWGTPTFVTLDLGIIIEADSPTRIILPGLIEVILPKKGLAILQLRCAFLGVLDFDKGELSFDASLYNSWLLGLELTGDIALRVRWRNESGFLLSIGGFHPSFKPPSALDPGPLRRITLRLDSDNPSFFLNAYFALTSNTLQVGARVEMKAKVGSVRIEGFLGFDALFQFRPFHLIATIDAGVTMYWRSHRLFSVKLHFQLEGPAPWVASGTASFSVWIFDIDVDFSFTWGETRTETLETVEIMSLLRQGLEASENWVAPLPQRRFSAVRHRDRPKGETTPLVQPAGSLRVSQQSIPLNLKLDRVGNSEPADFREIRLKRVDIEGQEVKGTEPALEDFAPASFRNLEDAEKLRAKSFEKNQAGFLLDDDRLRTGYAIAHDFDFEEVISDFDPTAPQTPASETQPLTKSIQKEPAGLTQAIFEQHARKGVIGQSDLSKKVRAQTNRIPGKTVVGIRPEQFIIVQKDNLNKWSGWSRGSRAEAENALDKALKADPKQKGKLQIIPG